MNQLKPQALQERRASPQASEIRFIRIKEVASICGMCRSSIYEAMRDGGFPKPVRLYGRTTAWIQSEVLAWAGTRVKQYRSTEKP